MADLGDDAVMKFLRRKHAAEYVRTEWGLPCACQTLAKLAVVGGGPVYRKAGRYPLYRTEDLDRWAQSKIGSPRGSTTQHDEWEQLSVRDHPDA